jgi:hypothetical protein
LSSWRRLSMDEPEQVLVVPPQTLRYIAIATTVLYIALAAVVVYVFLNARHTTNELKAAAERNATAVAGLCSLRTDLGERQLAALAFLRDNPNGTPGIPASLIRNSINTTARTLHALQVVECNDSGG